MIKFILLVGVVGLFVGGALAVRHLPWWGLILVLLGLILTVRYLGGWLLKKAFLIPFKMKGAVLRNAHAQVHSVTRTTAPARLADEELDSAEAGSGQRESPLPEAAPSYFLLDVTITPRQPGGKFTHWEPGELLLTRIDLVIDPRRPDSDEDDTCSVADLKVEQDGSFNDDEIGKYEGPQRLQMTLAVREGVDRLKFQYYFEQFGEVALPVSIVAG